MTFLSFRNGAWIVSSLAVSIKRFCWQFSSKCEVVNSQFAFYLPVGIRPAITGITTDYMNLYKSFFIGLSLSHLLVGVVAVRVYKMWTLRPELSCLIDPFTQDLTASTAGGHVILVYKTRTVHKPSFPQDFTCFSSVQTLTRFHDGASVSCGTTVSPCNFSSTIKKMQLLSWTTEFTSCC